MEAIMAAFNSVTLVGNLTRDPEQRGLQSGTAVANTTIAVNSRYQEKDSVLYIDLIAYGKLAEIFSKYTTKGSSVLINGRLTYRQWDQDGQKRSKHEIIVNSIQLLDKRDTNMDDQEPVKTTEAKTTETVKNNTVDDIPF